MSGDIIIVLWYLACNFAKNRKISETMGNGILSMPGLELGLELGLESDLEIRTSGY